MKVPMQASLIILTLLGAAGVARADAPKAKDAIEYRQSVMTVIKWQFEPMAAMVKGKMPFNKDLFAQNAAYLEVLSKLPLEGFTPGSDKGDTKAKPEIWTDWDKFKSRMNDFQMESAKLASVAKDGDMNAIRAQFGDTAKTCKACHDDFKKK